MRGIEGGVRGADLAADAANPRQGDFSSGLAYFPAAGEFLPAFTASAFAAALYNADNLAEMRRLVHEADVSERIAISRLFAQELADIDSSLEAWASSEPELLLTVVLPERNLELELQVTALFLGLSQRLSDPDTADLTFQLAHETDEIVGDRIP